MSTHDTERGGDLEDERRVDEESIEGVRERIQQLVTESDERLADVSDPADEIERTMEELAGPAREATELVESTDSRTLLAALGLLDPDEGDDAAATSVPAAIATGDPNQVATLRTVLTLSKLPVAAEEGEDGEADVDAVTSESERRERLQTLQVLAADREPDDWTLPKRTTEDGASGASGEDGGIESALRSALDGARNELDEVTPGLGDDADADGDADAATGDEPETYADDETSLAVDADRLDELDLDRDALEGLDMEVDSDLLDELAALDVDVDREGLEALVDADLEVSELGELDADLDSLSDLADMDLEGLSEMTDEMALGGDSSASGTRLSTMPDQNRADMRAVRRHSTMPDRS